MERYQWSALNKQQVGAYAEYFVKMELTMYGFQVYATEVDDRGIDFVARHERGPFLQIQVKSVRFKSQNPSGYVFMAKDKFARDRSELTESRYVALGLLRDDLPPELFLIPASAWLEPNAVFVDRDYPGSEKSSPEWGINLSKKNFSLLDPFQFAVVAEKLTYPRSAQREIIKHFGTIDFDPDYDYKAARKSKEDEAVVDIPEEQSAV